MAGRPRDHHDPGGSDCRRRAAPLLHRAGPRGASGTGVGVPGLSPAGVLAGVGRPIGPSSLVRRPAVLGPARAVLRGPAAQVLIVGLGPAANGTNRTGRMFTGDSSGDFLYAALHRTGWASHPTSVAAGDGQTLTGIRIVAAVRCAPPQNSPTASERATCSAWLQRELELASPHLRAVLTLGAVGWDAALAAARSIGWQVPRPKPRFRHAGQAVLTAADGRQIRLVGCYHVSPTTPSPVG